MQELINKYFSNLCEEKFFKYDDETIIGKVKDVLEDLKKQIKYVNNKKNNVEKNDAKFITKEAKKLIQEIKKEYSNENDVIQLEIHPMLGFYVLQDKEVLLDELKNYYDEMEDK